MEKRFNAACVIADGSSTDIPLTTVQLAHINLNTIHSQTIKELTEAHAQYANALMMLRVLETNVSTDSFVKALFGCGPNSNDGAAPATRITIEMVYPGK